MAFVAAALLVSARPTLAADPSTFRIAAVIGLSGPLALATRQYVMEDGRIAWSGTTAEMAADAAAPERLLSL